MIEKSAPIPVKAGGTPAPKEPDISSKDLRKLGAQAAALGLRIRLTSTAGETADLYHRALSDLASQPATLQGIYGITRNDFATLLRAAIANASSAGVDKNGEAAKLLSDGVDNNFKSADANKLLDSPVSAFSTGAAFDKIKAMRMEEQSLPAAILEKVLKVLAYIINTLPPYMLYEVVSQRLVIDPNAISIGRTLPHPTEIVPLVLAGGPALRDYFEKWSPELALKRAELLVAMAHPHLSPTGQTDYAQYLLNALRATYDFLPEESYAQLRALQAQDPKAFAESLNNFSFNRARDILNFGVQKIRDLTISWHSDRKPTLVDFGIALAINWTAKDFPEELRQRATAFAKTILDGGDAQRSREFLTFFLAQRFSSNPSAAKREISTLGKTFDIWTRERAAGSDGWVFETDSAKFRFGGYRVEEDVAQAIAARAASIYDPKELHAFAKAIEHTADFDDLGGNVAVQNDRLRALVAHFGDPRLPALEKFIDQATKKLNGDFADGVVGDPNRVHALAEWMTAHIDALPIGQAILDLLPDEAAGQNQHEAMAKIIATITTNDPKEAPAIIAAGRHWLMGDATAADLAYFK